MALHSDAEKLKATIKKRMEAEILGKNIPRHFHGALEFVSATIGTTMVGKPLTVYKEVAGAEQCPISMTQELARRIKNATYFEGFWADTSNATLSPQKGAWCMLINGEIIDHLDHDHRNIVYVGVEVDKERAPNPDHSGAGNFLSDAQYLFNMTTQKGIYPEQIAQAAKEDGIKKMQARIEGARKLQQKDVLSMG